MFIALYDLRSNTGTGISYIFPLFVLSLFISRSPSLYHYHYIFVLNAHL